MKRALRIAKNVCVWIVLIFTVLMVIFTLLSVTVFGRADRSLFGVKAFIVLSDSMKATDFEAGDLIFVKEVDPQQLQAGDIISFYSTNPESYGQVVTHKIRYHTVDEKGAPAFRTYGTTTDKDDISVVTYDYIIGKYTASLPNVGTFFAFLKTPAGYLLCILLPFLILIGVQASQSIKLFVQYRKEQKSVLEAEHARTRLLEEELQRLKEQLSSQNSTQEKEEE